MDRTRVVDYICEQILARTLEPDEKIPSVRELAACTGINPKIVQLAYTELQGDEVLVVRRGCGQYVSNNAEALIRKNRSDKLYQHDLPTLFAAMNRLGFSWSTVTAEYEIACERLNIKAVLYG